MTRRDRIGEHNGRFDLPGDRSAFGTLSLQAARPPIVSLHPDATQMLGSGSRAFPQDSHIDRLVGRLFSNEEVVLGDVHLREWFPNQFHASSRWAVIGLGVAAVEGGRWRSLSLRITGLELILGSAISATRWPRSPVVSPRTYSADLTEDEYVSRVDGVTLTATYETSFAFADPYRFNLSSYATLRMDAREPLTVDQWVRDWVDPVVSLLTLATGEREEINSITLTSPDTEEGSVPDDAAPSGTTGYLYGSWIHQREQPAERRVRSDGSPAMPLFLLDGAPPLADLVQAWRTDVADQTATTLYRLSLDPSLPTTVRFLLSVQALESLDAGEREEIEAQEDAAHHDGRRTALAALDALDDDILPSDARRFIRHNLARRPYRSLGGRLHRIMSGVPDGDERRRLWTRVTDPLGTALEGLGRPAAPLHERLASTRNVLAHGDIVESALVAPATRILQAVLRGEFLRRLGFEHEELVKAFDRMDRHLG